MIILLLLALAQSSFSKEDECSKFNYYCGVLAAANGNNLVVLKETGLFLSTDRGRYWARIETKSIPVETKSVPVDKIKFIAYCGNSLFAATDNEIFVSADDGESWTSRNFSNCNDGTPILQFTVSGGNLIVNTGKNVFLSPDLGVNWIKFNIGLSDENIMQISAIGSDIYAGSKNGIYLSTDHGMNWKKIKNKAPLDKFPTGYMSLAKSGNSFFLSNSESIYVSKDNCDWEKASNNFPVRYIGPVAVRGNHFYIGTPEGLYISTDNGQTWNLDGNLMPCSIRMLITDGDRIYTYVGNYGLYVSEYNGSGWEKVGRDPVCASIINKDGILYATTNNGVMMSRDGGSGWTQNNNSLADMDVSAIAFRENILFAGTATGVFASSDEGAAWSPAGLANNGIISLAVKGCYLFAVTDSGEIYRMAEQGKEWNRIIIGLPEVKVDHLEVQGNEILAWTQSSGVYSSTNDGAVWMEHKTGIITAPIVSDRLTEHDRSLKTPLGRFISYHDYSYWEYIGNGLPDYARSIAAKGDSIYGVSNETVFLSTNNCRNWKRVDLTDDKTEIIDIIISGNNLIVSSGKGMIISSDNGKNWKETYHTPQGLSYFSLSVSGDSVFGADGFGGFIISDDNGATWTEYDSYVEVNSLITRDNMMIAGTGRGLFVSEDKSRNWEKYDLGKRAREVYRIIAAGTNLIAGTDVGIFLSTDKGANWIEIREGLPGTYISSLVTQGRRILTATDNRIYISDDSGLNWKKLESLGSDDFQVHNLAVYGDSIYAGNYHDKIFLSSDRGENWKKVYDGNLCRLLSINCDYFKYLFPDTDESVCGALVTSDDGDSWNLIDNYRSNTFDADDGDPAKFSFNNCGNIHWEQVNKGLSSWKAWSLSANPGLLYATTEEKGFYISCDNGDNWTYINSMLKYSNHLSNVFHGIYDRLLYYRDVNTLAVKGDSIFVGTSHGILLSDNNGKTWSKVSRDLTDDNIVSLVVSGDYLFAATNGGGIFRARLSDFGMNN